MAMTQAMAQAMAQAQAMVMAQAQAQAMAQAMVQAMAQAQAMAMTMAVCINKFKEEYMGKVMRTYYLDKELTKEFLIYTINHDTSVSKEIEKFMREKLNEISKTNNKK